MVKGPLEVVLSDTAKADYNRIRLGAYNRRLDANANREAIARLQRTRFLLKDLRNPESIALDRPMINDLAWMLNRSEGTTFVYYRRSVSDQKIVVYHLCEHGTTDMYMLLAEMVFAGKTEMLSALGINPPPAPQSYSILIQ